MKALQTAPTGGPLAATLQRLYCRGSLMNRFCSNGAVTQTPAAVAGFLVGLGDVARAFPEATVDYEALNALASHIDCAVGAAHQDHGRESGKN